MPHSDHFKLTDDLIRHLDPILVGVRDPFIESRYTGFLAVCSVTVLELSLKTIFIEFADAKHTVLGSFCAEYFDRINGRISLDVIQKDYLKKFGEKYQKRFQKRLQALEKQRLAKSRESVRSSYGNLITWRNEFAHGGTVPANASYLEVKRAYDCGKAIMNCLAGCMTR